VDMGDYLECRSIGGGDRFLLDSDSNLGLGEMGETEKKFGRSKREGGVPGA
jgi:hypothetical protein